MRYLWGIGRLEPFIARWLAASRQTDQYGNFHVVLFIGKFQGHLQIVKAMLGAKSKGAMAVLENQGRIDVGSPFTKGLQVRERKRILNEYFHSREEIVDGGEEFHRTSESLGSIQSLDGKFMG